MGLEPKKYLEELRKRKKDSHVYKPFQFHGLEIANVLHDLDHKALYIKLAKEYNPEALRQLAKSISENKKIKNKGAYFMRCFSAEKEKYGRKNIQTRKS